MVYVLARRNNRNNDNMCPPQQESVNCFRAGAPALRAAGINIEGGILEAYDEVDRTAIL